MLDQEEWNGVKAFGVAGETVIPVGCKGGDTLILAGVSEFLGLWYFGGVEVKCGLKYEFSGRVN